MFFIFQSIKNDWLLIVLRYSFPVVNCIWGEPLITALDVGHGFDVVDEPQRPAAVREEMDNEVHIIKKDGYLFDYVALCIEEGSRNCILGPTASGKSTLLKILAKQLNPIEGKVHHVSGLRIGYFDSNVADAIIASVSSSTSALDYLTERYSTKTEQDLRGRLSSFGLSPTTQAKTPLCYLSGGEKCRFVLASIMLENPSVLCLDNPTSNLDVQSVQALIYGLRKWNGTLLIVSQDVDFLRSLEDVKCVALIPEEGKLRRVEGGIDAYLKSFQIR
jgi:ATPase subunit of ABC transporter with duplicated ATPase domains